MRRLPANAAREDFAEHPEVAAQAVQRVFESRRTVLLDTEVRHPGEEIARDRRRTERRGQPAFTWDLADFVVVEEGGSSE